ncbi:MAG: hypothetical protein WBD02_02725 [Acidimicrobiia bacterium]
MTQPTGTPDFGLAGRGVSRGDSASGATLRIPGRVPAGITMLTAVVSVGMLALCVWIFTSSVSQKDRFIAIPFVTFAMVPFVLIGWAASRRDIEITDSEITQERPFSRRPIRISIDEIQSIEYTGEPVRVVLYGGVAVAAGKILMAVVMLATRTFGKRRRPNRLPPAEQGVMILTTTLGESRRCVGATTQLDAAVRALLERRFAQGNLSLELQSLLDEVAKRNDPWKQSVSAYRRFGPAIAAALVAIGITSALVGPKPLSKTEQRDRLRQLITDEATKRFGQPPTSLVLETDCQNGTHLWYDGSSSGASQCRADFRFAKPLSNGSLTASTFYLVVADPPRIKKACENELCGDPTAPPELKEDFEDN